jgi:hypothetical protein
MKEKHFLTCKNKKCAQPIWLPLPIVQDINPRHQLWPLDEKPRTFLCLDCWHADEYKPEDVHPYPVDKRIPPQADVTDTVSRIELRCAEPNCRATVHILTIAKSKQTEPSVIPGWSAKEKSGIVRCSQGHVTRLSSYSRQPPKVEKDQDWKT